MQTDNQQTCPDMLKFFTVNLNSQGREWEVGWEVGGVSGVQRYAEG